MITFTELMQSTKEIRGKSQKEVTSDEISKFRADIQSTYRLFVQFPAPEAVEYSLWIHDEPFNFPVMESNTAGVPQLISREIELESQMMEPLSKEFFTALLQAYENCMQVGLEEYFGDEAQQFDETLANVYGGALVDRERWVIGELVVYMSQNRRDPIEELLPLLIWVDSQTEIGCPSLPENNPAEFREN